MCSIFNNFRFLNSGSVWALYLLALEIRAAFFCNFRIISHLKPHNVMPQFKCGNISELYSIIFMFKGSILLSLFNRILQHLTDNLSIRLFQFNCSLKCIPRKLKSSTLSIICLSICSNSVWTFFLEVLKSIYLVFRLFYWFIRTRTLRSKCRRFKRRGLKTTLRCL